MLALYVPNLVRFPFAALRAKGALELGLLVALVGEVALQRVLPDVTPAALDALEVAPNAVRGRRRFPLRRRRAAVRDDGEVEPGRKGGALRGLPVVRFVLLDLDPYRKGL